MSILPLTRDRYNFEDKISKSELQTITGNPEIKYLQTSSATKAKTFELINEYVVKKRPDIQIRLYGYYTKGCDLSVLSYLRDVNRLSIDCLHDGKNISNITQLPKLSEVSVGIFNLDDFEFLAGLPANITSLSLHATRSKKPKLDHLNRFKNLQTLYLEGQQNNIEVLADLLELQDLTLRSVSTANLNYILPLKKLISLDIKLGGIKNFDATTELGNLRYLELWQVRDLASLEFVGEISSLQYLFLQSLPQVKKLPKLTANRKLRRIYVENLKGLMDFTSLAQAPALEEFILTMGQKQSPAQLKPLLLNTSLKKALVLFGSEKKTLEFSELLNGRGVEKFKHSPFIFQ